GTLAPLHFPTKPGLLTNRISSWCRMNSIISTAQKGFMPHDGVYEHNYIIQKRIEEAKRQKDDLCVAWIDISNAFGSIPHKCIIEALRRRGAGN
ncbi:hypothetical protein ACUWC2_28775, partial [Klebsiella pneumoniae]|uniref:hypothetical protein n=1 Tax=Klebsiella pneumoniae TaxID=573 RepID=UPI0040556AF0